MHIEDGILPPKAWGFLVWGHNLIHYSRNNINKETGTGESYL